MTNNEERTCKNCKHFLKYYYIYLNYLKSAGCGKCINDKTHYKKRNRNAETEACENWEPAENEKAEQNERIQKTIRNMQRNLSQILQILKTE